MTTCHSPPGRVALVDDEPHAATAINRLLTLAGVEDVSTFTSGDAFLAEVAGGGRFAVVLLDVMMPGTSGIDTLIALRERDPLAAVIMVTGRDDADTAVRCMRAGADDYLVKPIDAARLNLTIERAAAQHATRLEAATLRRLFLQPSPAIPEAFAQLVTASPRMHRLFAYGAAIARGGEPILITGESGTGKEIFARALHLASGRDGPFVAINVAGLDDTLLADALFGHRAGAFTGAQRAREGHIARAGRGTLLLDEIGDLAEAGQVKLLRVIQEREYLPLGTLHPEPVRARIIATTHRDDALRRDLYYRLSGYHITLPPLRERREDIGPLVTHFAAQAAEDLGIKSPAITPDVIHGLAARPFPGNLRELRAAVFGAVAVAGGDTLRWHHFDPLSPATATAARPKTGAEPSAEATARAALGLMSEAEIAQLRRDNMRRALESCQWRVGGRRGAAALLGIPASTLASRMRSMGLQPPAATGDGAGEDEPS